MTMETMTTTQLTATLPLARLRRVTEYIHEHLDQHLTLAQLGAVVFMSPYHFARLFQHSTGLPPHRFVVHARIDHAATLLAAPDLSISQISRVVGFRSPSHFATVFHRIKGVTPSEYRARQVLDAGARRGAVASPVAQEGGRDGLQ
jgi:AraC family transcriptional regulator